MWLKLVPWKLVGKTILIGAVLAFFAYPWVGMNVARGNAEAAERELAAEEKLNEQYVIANAEWVAINDERNEITLAARKKSNEYRLAMLEERRRRAEDRHAAAQREMELASQITATDAGEVLDQLIVSLGFGGG